MFVTGNTVDGVGSCKGDSGGPLLKMNDAYTGYIQIGIVHGGISGCGNKQYPSIYARIEDPEIHEFITGVSKLLSCFEEIALEVQ